MHKPLLRASLLVLALTGCTALAQPQELVPTDGIYPEVIEHPVPADLSQFKQPPSLVADLAAIQSGSLEERLAALAAKSKRDQVFVQGGTFMMGDFGPLQSEEKLPWDGNSHSSPLHRVTLDSYSISKYKVTLAEFDLYAQANDVPSVQTESVYTDSIAGKPPYRSPDKPAGTTWYQAKAYCQWLGGGADRAAVRPADRSAMGVRRAGPWSLHRLSDRQRQVGVERQRARLRVEQDHQQRRPAASCDVPTQSPWLVRLDDQHDGLGAGLVFLRLPRRQR